MYEIIVTKIIAPIVVLLVATLIWQWKQNKTRESINNDKVITLETRIEDLEKKFWSKKDLATMIKETIKGEFNDFELKLLNTGRIKPACNKE